jgi:hypothetical protein
VVPKTQAASRASNPNHKCPIIQFNRQPKGREQIGKQWVGSEGEKDITYRKAATGSFRKYSMEPILWKTWDQRLSRFWDFLGFGSLHQKKLQHMLTVVKNIH